MLLGLGGLLLTLVLSGAGAPPRPAARGRRFRVLSTVAAIFESEEEAARIKGRRLRWAIGLLLASVAVVLVGATLEALL